MCDTRINKIRWLSKYLIKYWLKIWSKYVWVVFGMFYTRRGPFRHVQVIDLSSDEKPQTSTKWLKKSIFTHDFNFEK